MNNTAWVDNLLFMCCSTLSWDISSSSSSLFFPKIIQSLTTPLPPPISYAQTYFERSTWHKLRDVTSAIANSIVSDGMSDYACVSRCRGYCVQPSPGVCLPELVGWRWWQCIRWWSASSLPLVSVWQAGEASYMVPLCKKRKLRTLGVIQHQKRKDAC